MSKIDDNILDFIETKINELIDATEAKFDQSIATELSLATATTAAQCAIAGGTTKAEFIQFMKIIYDQCQQDNPYMETDYSKLN